MYVFIVFAIVFTINTVKITIITHVIVQKLIPLYLKIKLNIVLSKIGGNETSS